MAVVLGIDYGSKRIGIARGTTEGRLATPLMSLHNDQSLFKQLRQVIAKEGAKQLIVGWPRGLDGQETAQTAAAKQFASKLAKQTGLKSTLQDEAATTVEGGQRWPAAQPDSAAAALILQDYLDALK